jgi:hypothetical protein
MNTFWEHFSEIITDPAHTAVEFLFVLLDYAVIQVVVHRVRRHFHRDMAGTGDVGTPITVRADGSLWAGDKPVFFHFADEEAPDEVPVS